MLLNMSGLPKKKDGARRFVKRTRASMVSKHIARYIYQNGLGVGDKLPTQMEFCQKMGMCQDTVHLAMRHLVDIGLIARRTYHGSEIINLEGLHRLTWTIGIAAFDFPIQGPGGAGAWLLHALLSEAARRNCTCHTYLSVGEPPRTRNTFSKFAGLQDDVASQTIDGLVTLEEVDAQACAACARAGIPLLHCGFMKSTMPFAVLLDYRGMVADATTALLARGARRLALVVTPGLEVENFDDLVRRSAGPLGISGVSTEMLAVMCTMESGTRVASQMAQRSAEERPDGLIFLDDFTAVGAAHALAGMAGSYSPRLAVFSNRQLPQVWPEPVVRYELDITEVAKCAMTMLRQVLLNPSLPPWQQRVPIRMANGANAGTGHA